MEAGYAVIVLAGGGGRRLGGVDKPALPVGGRPMLWRVLDAAADASPRVVVGPLRQDLPVDVVQVREEPPGGGPVAAIAAGLAAIRHLEAPGGDPGEDVAVLAGDLPFLTGGALRRLREALADHPGTGAAVLLDAAGRQQWLCGVWRAAVLRERVAAIAPVAGRAMRDLVSGVRLAGVEVRAGPADPPPWYDCDTEADYRRAEEWRHERT